MGYEVRLTAKARGDLNEIVAYIAQDNPLAAERLGDELAAEADSLSDHPYRGGSVRRRRNVRRLVHGRVVTASYDNVTTLWPSVLNCAE